MRIVMYTESYEPLAVLDVPDSHVDLLNRYPGDEIRMAVQEPLQDYNPRAWAVPSFQHVAGRLMVEGMEWADRRTRPILVVKGQALSESMCTPGSRTLDKCLSLFHGAVSQIMQRYPHERGSVGHEGVQVNINRTPLLNVEAADIDAAYWNDLRPGQIARVPPNLEAAFQHNVREYMVTGGATLNAAAAWPGESVAAQTAQAGSVGTGLTATQILENARRFLDDVTAPPALRVEPGGDTATLTAPRTTVRRRRP